MCLLARQIEQKIKLYETEYDEKVLGQKPCKKQNMRKRFRISKVISTPLIEPLSACRK
jgi:hypothetical protein